MGLYLRWDYIGNAGPEIRFWNRNWIFRVNGSGFALSLVKERRSNERTMQFRGTDDDDDDDALFIVE